MEIEPKYFEHPDLSIRCIEWHALQKLVRRDTDLTNIEEHTKHTLKDLKTEKDLMDDWLIKKQEAE